MTTSISWALNILCALSCLPTVANLYDVVTVIATITKTTRTVAISATEKIT
jgi:hypothetical protein